VQKYKQCVECANKENKTEQNSEIIFNFATVFETKKYDKMGNFERITKSRGWSIEQYTKSIHGYLVFPELEGEIEPRMKFCGKEVLIWSLNNCLGLANHPEVWKGDAKATMETDACKSDSFNLVADNFKRTENWNICG
jgi:7-keto-8-aminopelargonate synthetase-like enzyme